jgi:hypothetical protein
LAWKAGIQWRNVTKACNTAKLEVVAQINDGVTDDSPINSAGRPSVAPPKLLLRLQKSKRPLWVGFCPTRPDPRCSRRWFPHRAVVGQFQPFRANQGFRFWVAIVMQL